MNITRTYENIQRRIHADVALVCELMVAKHYRADSSPKCNAKPPFLAQQTPPMAV